MKRLLKKAPFYITMLTFSTSLLFSHGGESHEKKTPTTSIIQNDIKTVKEPTTIIKKESPMSAISDTENIRTTVYKEINKTYLSNIKPIFEKKCFDCHGTLTKKPWYYELPGVSYMIQKDMKEAKEHMDMRKDFPFVSHESPYNDLKSLKDIALKGGMPPLQYILGHWDASLTDSESKVLLQWSQDAIIRLDEVGVSDTNSTH